MKRPPDVWHVDTRPRCPADTGDDYQRARRQLHYRESARFAGRRCDMCGYTAPPDGREDCPLCKIGIMEAA